MRLSSWLEKSCKDLSRGTLPIATPQAFQSELLRDALSTRAPGQWFTNKIALAQAMRGVVYLAVNTLATQFSAARPVLYELTDDEMDEDGKIRLSRHDPMYNLIRHPNPLDTWADVAYQMSMQLDTTGMSLVWMPPDDEGFEPQEMYVIPTGTALPLPRSLQYPQGAYRVVPYYASAFAVAPNYNAGAGAVIPAEQVVTVRNHHPLLRWEGYAVLTAVSLSVDTITGIDQSRFAGMQQGCEQTIALELDAATQMPDVEGMRRIREEWQKVYAGAKNYGKIVLTPPGAKINNFSTEPDKMAWQEGWAQIADFILAAYQTPKAITGMSGDLNYATLYASLRQFHWMSLDPRLSKFGGALTKHWINPVYGAEYVLELEAKKIDDDQLKQTKLKNDMACGAITYQEYRREQGYPDLDPKTHPWVLERVSASSSPKEATATGDSHDEPKQDPTVEASRPDNRLGDGAAGPRKGAEGWLRRRGDLLADAFEHHKTNGTIHAADVN